MARSSLRKLSNKPGRRRRGRHAGALPLGHAAIRCALSHEVINNATPLRPCYNIDTNRMGQSGSGCSNEMLMARQRAAYMLHQRRQRVTFALRMALIFFVMLFGSS